MKERPSCVADGCDNRVVGKAAGLERDVEDHWVLGELVEVGDGGQEDVGGGGDRGELARADGGEDGEERVVVVADRLDLYLLASVIYLVSQQDIPLARPALPGCCPCDQHSA